MKDGLMMWLLMKPLKWALEADRFGGSSERERDTSSTINDEEKEAG